MNASELTKISKHISNALVTEFEDWELDSGTE
jgi:hypothetical protein